MSDFTIIEINGVKLEVDLRSAKRVDQFKVGDNVKVLLKKYQSTWESSAGVIVGFDNFKELPTITICYVEGNSYSAEVKFCYYNNESKDIEICHMAEHEKLLDKRKCVDYLDRVILKAQNDLDDLVRKKSYFLDNYNKHFND